MTLAQLLGPQEPESRVLSREVAFRQDSQPRAIPAVVFDALKRLQELENWSTRDNPERGRVAEALREYCKVVRCVEASVEFKPEEIASIQEPLFRYLHSSRLFSDFYVFREVLQALPSLSLPLFRKLTDTILSTDGYGFFDQVKLNTQSTAPLLPDLIALAQDNVATADPELLGASLLFLADMYVAKRLHNVRFLEAAFERNDLKPETLMRVIITLGKCDYDFNPSKSDQRILFDVGVEAARRASSNLLKKCIATRSEPHVEFGFRVQRILDLCNDKPSVEGMFELCELVQGLPEYFCYGDKPTLKMAIGVVRQAVLRAMGPYCDFEALRLRELSLTSFNGSARDRAKHHRAQTGAQLHEAAGSNMPVSALSSVERLPLQPPDRGLPRVSLARASRELMQQPWHGDFSALWRACSSPSHIIENAPGAVVLREVLQDPRTAIELQRELQKRDSGEIPTTPHELWNFGRSLARLIRYERSFGSVDPTKVSVVLKESLLVLVGNRRIAQSVVPELLNIVGIPAVSTQSLGAVSLPWNLHPDPRPLICAIARDILYDVKGTLGFTTRYRLGFRR